MIALLGPGAKKSLREWRRKGNALLSADISDVLDRGRTTVVTIGPSCQPMIAPELKHQEGPEGLAMVAQARLVFADPAGDLLGAKEPLPCQSLAAQELRHQRGQRSAQPRRHRDAEALLGASQDRRRQPARRRALEQPLGLVSSELERRRAGPG